MTIDQCPFCLIARGEDGIAREVFRSKQVVAFFPTEPAALGHTLVVPSKHIASIWELDDETAAAMVGATLAIAHAIRSAFAPDGLNLIQSNGRAATQTVDHLHVHVVPRWQGDDFGRIWPETTEFTEQNKDEALVRVQASLVLTRSSACDGEGKPSGDG